LITVLKKLYLSCDLSFDHNDICFTEVGGVTLVFVPAIDVSNNETLVVCVLHCQVAILSEMMNSNRASEKLLTLYASFMGLGALALLRGLLTCSSKSASALGKRPALTRKKRA